MKALAAPFLLPIAGKPIENGAVVVEGSRIIDLLPRAKIAAKYPDVEIEEFPQSVLMPGLVNAHTRLDLLFFNSARSSDFFDLLLASWEYQKRLTLAERRHALEEGTRQLLRFGTTAVGDSGQYAGILPQLARSPIRMTLFPELLTGGDPNISETYEAVFSQVEEIRGIASERISAGLAPYAPYTLSRHLLKIVADQAHATGMPVKIHVAETFSEMQFFYESKGEIAEKLFPEMGWGEAIPPPHRKTPVQYLESIGFLEGRPTLIGCNHLADPDLESLARRGVKVIHSPRSNAHLKLGSPPIKKLRSVGVPVGLGTDGILHSLSLWDEMRHLQDHTPKTQVPSAPELLKMATLEGAMALGLQDRIGSFEAGKEADLIAIRAPKELTLKDLPAWLIAHVTDREIAAVFVGGKRVKI